MAVIDIRRRHGMTQDQAVATADSLAQSLASEYDVNYAWEGTVLRMRRTGIKGELQVDQNDISIHVELGFFFRPFKGRIEQEIHQHLDQMVGPV